MHRNGAGGYEVPAASIQQARKNAIAKHYPRARTKNGEDSELVSIPGLRDCPKCWQFSEQNTATRAGGASILPESGKVLARQFRAR